MAGRFYRAVVLPALGSVLSAAALAAGQPAMVPPQGQIAVKPAAAPKPNKVTAPLWRELTPEWRSTLTPLAGEWDSLPVVQRKRLLDVARRYPKMTSQQQERFRSRLEAWSKLTPEQRNEARNKFIKLKQLPPDKRQEVKQKWREQQKAGAPAPAASAAPVSPPAVPAPNPAQ